MHRQTAFVPILIDISGIYLSKITVGHEHMRTPAPVLTGYPSPQGDLSCVVARFIKLLTTWTVSILIVTIGLIHLGLLDHIAFRYFVLLHELMLLGIPFLSTAHFFGTHCTITLFLLHQCIPLSIICTRPSRNVTHYFLLFPYCAWHVYLCVCVVFIY